LTGNRCRDVLLIQVFDGPLKTEMDHVQFGFGDRSVGESLAD
jgi:hypothetical protein